MTDATHHQQELTEARIDIARLEVQYENLDSKVDQLQVSNAKQVQQLQEILNTLSEARGGWRTLMIVGGAAGVIGSAVTWAASHLSK
jgi:prefoldin subunit 5